MYMSRLAAIREFTYLKSLYDHGFPVPIPYSNSRHTILMSKVEAFPFGQVDQFWPEGTEEKKQKKILGEMFEELMQLIVRLGQHGLVHADFNEFNLLIDEDRKITLIDFPQMVSTRHSEAANFFDRDVGCVASYFAKKFKYLASSLPTLSEDIDESQRIDLDKELAASGHAHVATQAQREEFERVVAGRKDERSGASSGGSMDPIARRNQSDLLGEEEEEEGDEEENDGDDEEDESLMDSLGVDASDLAEQKESDPKELERLRKEVEGVTKEDNRRAGPGGKATKSAAAASSSSAREETKEEDNEDEDGEDDDEDDPSDDEATITRKRAALAAEKAERKAALEAKAAGKAARKVAEKERQRAERERRSTPGGDAAPTASDDSSAEAPSAEALAPEEQEGQDGEVEEDRASIASSAASQLSQLRMNSKNLLNIQVAKAQPVRHKKANVNKDRDRKKVHASIKEHLQM
jgi:serine/threonine-protein kinase RIO1